ncbi:sporulation-control protein [Desulforamulus putei DSM 12395]|uniref:Sporulation-control protein n=1 Tax=Desulforamulus putei DSM 12395 TaxID=1121429 RepID=A0A1M4SEL9_9FIRM|nr:sporulation protein [Desulforamulus putei]SHE30683.1 sporulation-control protein [Desulforamulus putei DSM 12395]
MFKKLMASLGVGAARVNLVLDNEQCRIGEKLTGKVLIEGGNVDQGIHALDVDIVMKFTVRGKEFTRTVDTVRVARDFRIKARETREIPFEHAIPIFYPVSKGSVSYSLATRMDIAQAVDTGDTDRLVVLPSREMTMVFNALEALGFKEKIGSGKIGKLGQQFEFYPSTLFAEQLQELELNFYLENNSMKLFMELELTGGYMRNGLEHHAELDLPAELLSGGSVQGIADFIREFLENELNRVSIQGPRMAPSYHNVQPHTHGPGFGGFMGGMVAGMLGGAMLGSLFDGDENEEAGDNGAGEEGSEDGFDFGLGDFMDFGDDEF